MADEKPAKGAKAKKDDAPKYVTEERFASLEGSVGKILDFMQAGANKTAEPAKPETPIEKEVRVKAGPQDEMVNPHWVEMAVEIIGDAVDHCEVFYPKGGGTVFTVVIKPELSNAPKDYLDRMKSDRRSKEIGAEGIAGVEQFCKLIKQNLARPR